MRRGPFIIYICVHWLLLFMMYEISRVVNSVRGIKIAVVDPNRTSSVCTTVVPFDTHIYKKMYYLYTVYTYDYEYCII